MEMDFICCCQIAFSVEGFSSLSSYSNMVQKDKESGWAEQNSVSKKKYKWSLDNISPRLQYSDNRDYQKKYPKLVFCLKFYVI